MNSGMKHDGTINSILEAARTEYAAKTPEQKAEVQAEIDRYEARMATPLVDRMLAACGRANKVEARAAMTQQTRLAVKDVLTDDDKDALRETHRILEDHPIGCYGSLENLLMLRGRGPAWLDEHIQERLWEWAWWADRFNMTDQAHMTNNVFKARPQDQIDAVKASRPYPEGWMPESRRESA